MMSLKKKMLITLSFVMLLVLSTSVGFFKTVDLDKVHITNISALEFANMYNPQNIENATVTASTKAIDIVVTYEDYYTICKESVIKKETRYGTTMDKVKEEEEKYQEENGLVYEIKSEEEKKIVYYREHSGNCPNHFKVVLENNKIVVYTILGKDKKEVYMNLDVNIDNVREELKKKIEFGMYINSKEELNKFIEDLES